VDLGVGDASTDEVYGAMDALLARQDARVANFCRSAWRPPLPAL